MVRSKRWPSISTQAGHSTSGIGSAFLGVYFQSPSEVAVAVQTVEKSERARLKSIGFVERPDLEESEKWLLESVDLTSEGFFELKKPQQQRDRLRQLVSDSVAPLEDSRPIGGSNGCGVTG